ncbi:MAG: hypothetical protein V1810_04970 [Candidatus Beckwithbacteria bacterium]
MGSVFVEKQLSDQEISAGRESIVQEVKQVFSGLGKITDGLVELSTNEDLIDWNRMPENLKRVFQPEFTFQPEEITRFYFACSPISEDDVARTITLRLERNNFPWSFIIAHAIVNEDNIEPWVEVGCFASQGQVTAAREGLQALVFSPDKRGGKEAWLNQKQQELKVLKDVYNFLLYNLHQPTGSDPVG